LRYRTRTDGLQIGHEEKRST